MRGRCTYRELIDGTLSMRDVALMNDAIRVRDENLRRADKAAREK